MSNTRRALVYAGILAIPIGAWLLHSILSGGKHVDRPRIEIEGEGFPCTVHTAGADFELPAPPIRILPTNAGAVDFLCALVDVDRIVALPKDAFGYSQLTGEDGPWRKLPTLAAFTGENVLSTEPDFVLAHSWQSGETLEVLRDAGIPVLELPDIEDWEGVVFAIEVLGRILGEDERAGALLADLEARRLVLAERSNGRNLRALQYGNWGTGGWSAGSRTTTDLLFSLAGLRNAAAENGMTGNVEIGFEQVLTIDPDVFLVGADPESGVSLAAELLRTEPVLAGLRAVKEGRIVELPAPLFATSSHCILEAAEALNAALEKL